MTVTATNFNDANFCRLRDAATNRTDSERDHSYFRLVDTKVSTANDLRR